MIQTIDLTVSITYENLLHPLDKTDQSLIKEFVSNVIESSGDFVEQTDDEGENPKRLYIRSAFVGVNDVDAPVTEEVSHE